MVEVGRIEEDGGEWERRRRLKEDRGDGGVWRIEEMGEERGDEGWMKWRRKED